MVIVLLSYLLSLIFILVGVAFFTLLERKILGYIHFRFGSNKVGILGIFQPFSDALKLFSKELLKFKKLNFYFYFFSPLLGLLLCLFLWLVFPFWGNMTFFNYNLILFFCISSLMVYFLLGCGWSGFSKYSIIGAYRSAAQAISYEVSMILLMISFCWLLGSYNFYYFFFWQKNVSFWVLSFPLFLIWLLICLAETNRSPFDFSEGESELVSGFNTEYGGGSFSLIFIGEYGSILFLSFLTSIFFLGANSYYIFMGLFISFFYVWIRGSFPRMRYDKLMLLAWKSILPYVLGMLLLIFSMSIFF